jgi:uncharacterized protein (DUF2461 family)
VDTDQVENKPKNLRWFVKDKLRSLDTPDGYLLVKDWDLFDAIRNRIEYRIDDVLYFELLAKTQIRMVIQLPKP